MRRKSGRSESHNGRIPSTYTTVFEVVEGEDFTASTAAHLARSTSLRVGRRPERYHHRVRGRSPGERHVDLMASVWHLHRGARITRHAPAHSRSYASAAQAAHADHRALTEQGRQGRGCAGDRFARTRPGAWRRCLRYWQRAAGREGNQRATLPGAGYYHVDRLRLWLILARGRNTGTFLLMLSAGLRRQRWGKFQASPCARLSDQILA
jgi:hypothetical protein